MNAKTKRNCKNVGKAVLAGVTFAVILAVTLSILHVPEQIQPLIGLFCGAAFGAWYFDKFDIWEF